SLGRHFRVRSSTKTACFAQRFGITGHLVKPSQTRLGYAKKIWSDASKDSAAKVFQTRRYYTITFHMRHLFAKRLRFREVGGGGHAHSHSRFAILILVYATLWAGRRMSTSFSFWKHYVQRALQVISTGGHTVVDLGSLTS